MSVIQNWGAPVSVVGHNNIVGVATVLTSPRHLPVILEYRYAREIREYAEHLHYQIRIARESPIFRIIRTIIHPTKWFRFSTFKAFIYSQSKPPRTECPDTVISNFLYRCDKRIEDFLRKLRKDRGICDSKDSEYLQLDLQRLVLYLSNALCHFQESGNSTTYRTEDLEKIILETFEFLSRCFYIQREQIRQFPRERLTVIEPIFLDVGSIYSNTIPIPSVFYQSKQILHELMQIVFQQKPWQLKLTQEEYVLQDKNLDIDIMADNWDLLVVPGVIICLTILVKRRDTLSDSCCRGCGATNIKKLDERRKIKCLSCKLVSDVVETSHIVELPDDCAASASCNPPLQQASRALEESFSRIRYEQDTRALPRISTPPLKASEPAPQSSSPPPETSELSKASKSLHKNSKSPTNISKQSYKSNNMGSQRTWQVAKDSTLGESIPLAVEVDRAIEADRARRIDRAMDVLWYCDNCKDGPKGGWQVQCVICDHHRDTCCITFDSH